MARGSILALALAAVAAVLTYCLMLSTSVYGWASIISLRRERRIGRVLVVYAILLFVAAADTVVGIMLIVYYRRSKTAVATAQAASIRS